MNISPRCMALGLVFASGLAVSGTAASSVLYSNGFETDTAGWLANTSRVGSGTGGVVSADGSFHAEVTAGAFTRWGGYNFGAGDAVATAFQEYWTTLDIYLDVDAGLGNDRRFDFTSAINNAAGSHLRDFAFNVGFYDDDGGPGANTDRFVISASNNTGRSNSFPKNPGRDPIAIDTTGWYTFQHHFYDNAGARSYGACHRQRAPIASTSSRPPPPYSTSVGAIPIHSNSAPPASSPSGSPYTASMRTPITRPR